MPGNDDWALWRSGGRVGEERTARFLAGYLRDCYGLFPALCSQTERWREKKLDGSDLEKEDAPEL